MSSVKRSEARELSSDQAILVLWRVLDPVSRQRWLKRSHSELHSICNVRYIAYSRYSRLIEAEAKRLRNWPHLLRGLLMRSRAR